MKYITTASISGFSFDVGSDWHLPPDRLEVLNSFPDHIKSQQGSDILFCVGDVIETSDGLNSSAHISKLLDGLSDLYKVIIFTPGNHDLRGRNNPWSDFANLPKNVYTTSTNSYGYRVLDLYDLHKDLPNLRILVADLFYDMKFLNPSILDISDGELIAQYRESNDGKHFLNGDIANFSHMAHHVRVRLDSSIDMLVTHSLPHPSLVTFRVAQITEEIEEKQKILGIPFICDPDHDTQEASRWNSTPERYRQWWNIKSFFMGSDVLSTTNFKDGLICVYGHNHRSNQSPAIINNKKVHFVSHQPCPWKTNYQ